MNKDSFDEYDSGIAPVYSKSLLSKYPGKLETFHKL
ncbi:Protein CBG25619 [Caenorhabditis briggsae]|uniref:Protein CBG25619 n=1 Tax=Caenorhabditis briggsae TaxID=6238 RepID=B6IFA4_CAEBR|nr:Protein CBG25619 [Caenorhabditis briggsae]CAR98584.1 Protein CBG25619 [Caenorhabditis briggsae]